MGYYLPKPVRPIRTETPIRRRAVETYAVNRKITDIFNSQMWCDRHAFIVGGGPSLAEFDFSQLKDKPATVAINQAYESFPCAKIWYGMDVKYIEWLRHGAMKSHSVYKDMAYAHWKNMPAKKCFACPSGFFEFEEDVYLMRRLNVMEVSRDLNRGIFVGNNSGTGAIMLAVALGATVINLLGFDMKIDTSVLGKTKTHFHKGYPAEVNADTINSRMEHYKAELCKLAPILHGAGIEVYNLNPDSALKCFEFKNFKEALTYKKEKVIHA